LAGPENKGWWNGLGRAGVPAGFILGEQVAVGSLYYFIQTSVNFNQPEKFAISTNQKCYTKKITLFVSFKRCRQCKQLPKFTGLFVFPPTALLSHIYCGAVSEGKGIESHNWFGARASQVHPFLSTLWIAG